MAWSWTPLPSIRRRDRRPSRRQERFRSPTSKPRIRTRRLLPPLGNGYVGTFSLDPVTEASGTGSGGWHYTVDNSDIQFLAQGQTLTQDYLVSVTAAHGGSTMHDVTVNLTATNRS